MTEHGPAVAPALLSRCHPRSASRSSDRMHSRVPARSGIVPSAIVRSCQYRDCPCPASEATPARGGGPCRQKKRRKQRSRSHTRGSSPREPRRYRKIEIHTHKKGRVLLRYRDVKSGRSSHCFAASIFFVSSGTASNRSAWCEERGRVRTQSCATEEREETERTGNESDVGHLEDRRVRVLRRDTATSQPELPP